MLDPSILLTEGWEDGSLLILRYVTGNADTAITQASLTSITYKVYDLDDSDAQVGAETTLTVTDVVFDTLQTTAPWDVDRDGAGYNFRVTIPGSYFPNGGRRYWIELNFNPVTGDDFPVVVDHLTVSRKSS